MFEHQTFNIYDLVVATSLHALTEMWFINSVSWLSHFLPTLEETIHHFQPLVC